MSPIRNADELKDAVGRTLGTTAWTDVTQALIDDFAELTGDRQWIHTDVERAREHADGGTTIAHGYLTLSLLPPLVDGLLNVTAVRGLNYGADKLRFLSPVPSGAKIRLTATVKDVAPQSGGWRTAIGCVVEVQDAQRPALVADLVFLFYFDDAAA